MVLGFDVALTVQKHPSTSCNGFRDGSDDGMLNWIAWLAAKVCRCALHSPRRGHNSLSECLHLAHPRNSPEQLISDEIPPKWESHCGFNLGPCLQIVTRVDSQTGALFLCSTLGARIAEASGWWRWANFSHNQVPCGKTHCQGELSRNV